jgi:hypothetical protein
MLWGNGRVDIDVGGVMLALTINRKETMLLRLIS